MGFARGSEAASKIAKSVLTNVPDQNRRYNIYRSIIDAMEDLDCDTLDEVSYCYGLKDHAWDEAMKSMGYDEDE